MRETETGQHLTQLLDFYMMMMMMMMTMTMMMMMMMMMIIIIIIIIIIFETRMWIRRLLDSRYGQLAGVCEHSICTIL